jgi:uncharacterized protein YdbL (DUF1318 family)
VSATAEEGYVKDKTGTARPLSAVSMDKTLADYFQNEALRVDPATGKVSGMYVSNPRQMIEDARKRLGLDRPLTEWDTIDPVSKKPVRAMVSASTYDDLVKDTINSAYRDEENAAQAARTDINNQRQAVYQSIAKYAEEAHVPYQAIQDHIAGKPVDPQYAQAIKQFDEAQAATMAGLAALGPFAALNAFGKVATEWGLAPKERLQFVRDMATYARKNNPDIPIPSNPNFLERWFDLDDRYHFSAGASAQPTGFGPGGMVGTGAATGPDAGGAMMGGQAIAGATGDDVQRALGPAAEGMISMALQMNPAEREHYLNQAGGASGFTVDGKPFFLTPDIINYIREQVRLRSQTPTK